MKLFVFGDTHGVTDFSYLLGRAREADVLLCVGDVTDFSTSIDAVARGLARLARDAQRPLIVTHGNHEESSFKQALAVHARDVVFLHESVHVTDELVIYGYGGGGFRQRDELVEKFLRSSHAQHGSREAVHVWLFHGPPYDAGVDVVPGLGPTGCRTKRSLIDELQPHVVLAGHIHERFGVVETLGSTTVVNPGPEGLLVEVSYPNTSSTSVSSSGDSR